MTTQPEIAIIEPNTLSSLGLKSILEEIIPMATIRTFHRFNELMDDTPDMYAHYRHKSMWNTMLSFFPENEKQLFWPVTVRSFNFPVYRFSIFMSRKRNW